MENTIEDYGTDMEITAETLAHAMKSQKITFEYTHYRTGEVLRSTGTLDPSITGSLVDHHQDSEVIAFWDVDEQDWRSVDISTIIGIYKNV